MIVMTIKNFFTMFFPLKEHFKYAWGQHSVAIIDTRSAVTLKNYTLKKKITLHYVIDNT